MKQFALKVESRSTQGRRASRGHREEGKIPAVIYGKATPRTLSVDSKAFAKLYSNVRGITALIEIEDEKGAKVLSLLQEVQRNRLNDAFNHIDFKEVKADEPMKARVRIRTTGESVGVKMENAILEVVYPEVTVRCLPKDLPEYLEVNVTDLHAGDAVFIKDLKVGAGIKFVEKADQVVITCNVPEVEEEKVADPAAAATAAAPGAPAADGAAAPAADPDAKAADGTKAAAAPAAKGAAPAKTDAKKK